MAFGYRVDGQNENARYVADTIPLSPDLHLSAAEVVELIYRRLALDARTCPQIADELNALLVPTSYVRAGREVKKRGERKQRTQGIWRSGRVRNIAIEPKYMGSLAWGRRSKRPREVIVASIEPLVSAELWQAAQDALRANGRMARNTDRHYLLKGVLSCAACDLAYVGSFDVRGGIVRYSCGGKSAHRGRYDGHCPSAFVRGDDLENLVWTDVERFLRHPGEVLADLEAEPVGDDARADAECLTLLGALHGLETQRERVKALNIRGRISDVEADDEFDRIGAERRAIEARVRAVQAPQRLFPDADAQSLLERLRGAWTRDPPTSSARRSSGCW